MRNRRTLRSVKDCFNSYPVNALTSAVAEASLNDAEYFGECVRRIKSTRAYMSAGLRKLGFSLPDSDANFVFAEHSRLSGKAVQDELRKQGIVVRRFSSPRIADRLRITVGTDAQTDVLLSALRKIVDSGIVT